MHPIPAVEVPIEAPKPPPRPELHVVAFPFYEEGTKAWHWAVYLTKYPPPEGTTKTPGAAIFTLPAEHPAPNADWRERCKVVKCADGDWDVRNSDGTMWYADWCGWMYFSDEYPMRLGSYESEEHARRALAAAPQPPEVSQ